jgi:hypothetical protein
MADIALADPDPAAHWHYYLGDHPVHGHGWIDEQGFLNVNKYAHRFIAYFNVPAHIWPVNARDWGLMEVIPLMGILLPIPGMGHPMLRTNRHGQEEMIPCRYNVHAAFEYMYVRVWTGLLDNCQLLTNRFPNGVKCAQVNSCRITSWTIDPDTQEARPDACLSCRRKGIDCGLTQITFPRRAHGGDMILDGRFPPTVPGFGQPILPPGWEPHRDEPARDVGRIRARIVGRR